MEYIVFLLVYLIVGGVVYKVALKATSKLPSSKRFYMHAAIVAIIFTPTLYISHNFAVVPAILLLVMGSYDPWVDWASILLLGVLPIGVVWVGIAVLKPMMALRKVNAGLVESKDGWSIHVLREALEYRQGDEVTVMNVGYDPGRREIIVYASEIEHPAKEIVRSNVERAVALLEGKWVVQ